MRRVFLGVAVVGVGFAGVAGDPLRLRSPVGLSPCRPCLQETRIDPRVPTNPDPLSLRQVDLSDFRYLETTHFILYCHPGLTPATLSRMQHALEATYREVVRYTGLSFDQAIVVVLYTESAYEVERRRRQVPEWGGAMYDGRVHLPVSNFRPLSPLLLRRLRHELCHAILDRFTLGQAPLWLHEGLAYGCEYMDDPGFLEDAFRRLLDERSLPSSDVLTRSSYVALGEAAVRDVYAAAYRWVQYLIEQYGREALDRWLDRMARGFPWESAFREVFGTDFPTLYETWRAGFR